MANNKNIVAEATTNTFNGKSKKHELLDYIIATAKRVKDKNLISRIHYTLKKANEDLEAVGRSDLYSLAKEIEAAIATTPAPVENSPKLKAPKTGDKKLDKKVAEVLAEDEADEAEEEPEEEVEETPKKKAPAKEKISEKKSTAKKPAVKKPIVETTEGLTTKELPLAKIFPKEIDHESLGKLVACPDKYHTVQEIREALDADKTIIFAAYWTKRHIKEYSYAQAYEVPVPKQGFPYDLDTLQALYVCEGIDRIYALSTYTEAMFRISSEDLVPTDCEGNDGTKFKMRYSAGMEFEIYEVVE